MSDQAEAPISETGSMQEARNKLAALRAPEPEIKQEAAPEQEETPVQAESEEIEPTETVETVEAEAQGTEQPEVTEQATQDTDDSIELDVDQFASLLQVENDKLSIDDDGQVKFRTKVDGEAGEASLDQLIKSYQNEASQNNKSMKIAEARKQQENILEQSNQYAQQQAQYAAVMLEKINSNFLNEVSQSNLDQLRIDDPAEYSAKQIEFSQKKQQIQEMANQSLQMLNESNQAQESEKQRLIQERIPVEAQAMKDAFKTMKVEVNETLQGDLTTYLTSQNFTNDEINENLDHRFMVMAYKAKMFDQGIKNVTKKQVKKKLPKVLKSGQKPSQKAVNTAKLAKVVTQAKKSGSMNDAIARLKATRQ